MAEVMRAATPPDGSPYFSSTPLRHSPSPRPSLVTDPSSLPDTLEADVNRYRSRYSLDSPDSSSVSSSPKFDKSSITSTPPSVISFDRKEFDDIDRADNDNDDGDDDDDDDTNGLYFPSYNDSKSSQTPKPSPVPDSPRRDDRSDETPASLTESSSTIESPPSSPGPKQIVDDTAVQEEPSRQVDYLSHDWREEDIWCSWKHIVSRRKHYGERSRLENASWRTWAKSKYQLKTISPETLNWLKDCDVTWLYGPLQESSLPRQPSETSSNLSKSNSFINKKPILKKRSVSEVMLQKSLSNSSLVRQAAAAVQAQRSCLKDRNQDGPRISRTPSEFIISSAEPGAGVTTFTSSSSSGLVSPESGRKHIRFDDKVEQCIAVDFESTVQGDDSSVIIKGTDESSSDGDDDEDEDVIMLKTKSKRLPSSTSSSRRSSIGQESKGIAKLPSTKLKFHGQAPDSASDEPPANRNSPYMGGRLQTSSSQETLRPADPATNFLIDDDDDADLSWSPSGAFATGTTQRSGIESSRDGAATPRHESSSGLRRTPSGMFMPFDDVDEDEEEQSLTSNGMLGRVVDTVNTARDIMHVIMNVGWRS